MIEVSGVTRLFGDKEAVSNVSFSISKGEMVGLLGPNGAGKTTIMKMITGYLMPSEGSISVEGIDVTDQPDLAAQKIGFLPEIPPVYPEMEVKEYLRFIAEIKGIEKDERSARVEEVMEIAQIPHMKDRLIANLSKGYRQRVGLAQALMGMPEILILDEPTVGLDPKQIADFRNLMVDLNKKHTVIYSTHILSEIDQICEKVIILNDGRLIAADTMENLENRKRGMDVFLIHAKGRREGIEEVLADIAGKKNVEYMHGERGSSWFRISAKNDDDMREKVFFGMARKNIGLVEMKSAQMTLEQVFLQLTSGKKGGAA